jgi:hypothetical protein
VHRLLNIGLLGLCVSVLFLGQLPLVQADAIAAGTVSRGMQADEVRSRLGDPRDTKVTQNVDGNPQVQMWIYADGLIVVVQEGYVIDSFTAKN